MTDKPQLLKRLLLTRVLRHPRRIRAGWGAGAGLLLGWSLVLAGAAVARAQVDPFGGGGASAATDDPFGAAPAPAPPPAPAGGRPGAATPDTEENPLVKQILGRPLTTPDQLLNAVELMIAMGRADRAKELVAKVDALSLPPEELAALVARHGPEMFWTLSLDAPYAPEGKIFANKALNAARDSARDPARLTELVNQLADNNAARRREAVLGLQAADDAAIPFLLKALADPARAEQHVAIRFGISRLGEYVVEPLLAATATSDAGLRAQLLLALGEMGVTRSLPDVVGALHDPGSSPEVRAAAADAARRIAGRLPSLAESARFLAKVAQRERDGDSLRPDSEGLVRLWRWDESLATPTPAKLPRWQAGRLLEARLAELLYRIAPQDPAHLRLRLVSGLNASRIDEGYESRLTAGPLVDLARQVGADAVEDALIAAIDEEEPLAAAGAAQLLGEIGDASLLYGGRPRALVGATQHSDRRVRFAALEAIMRLDPQDDFRGASWVSDALRVFATATGKPRVLVAHSRLEQARTWAGHLIDQGFEADVAVVGQELVELAPQHVDYDLIIVWDAITNPHLPVTLQRLREISTISRLPILVFARPEEYNRVRFSMGGDRLTIVHPEPLDATWTTRWALDAIALNQVAAPDALERNRYTTRAVEWIDELTAVSSRRPGYDLQGLRDVLETALLRPGTEAPAARALGRVPDPLAQQMLIGWASSENRSLASREAALGGFRESAQRFGLLLTQRQVADQYQIYNASATLDADTQRIRGAILDIIEQPKRSRAEVAAASADRAAVSPAESPTGAEPAVPTPPTPAAAPAAAAGP